MENTLKWLIIKENAIIGTKKKNKISGQNHNKNWNLNNQLLIEIIQKENFTYRNRIKPKKNKTCSEIIEIVLNKKNKLK